MHKTILSSGLVLILGLYLWGADHRLAPEAMAAAAEGSVQLRIFFI